MPTSPRELGPREELVGRQFTSITNYRSDIALLNYLLHDLRVLIRRAQKGEIELTPQQVITWEVHGLQRRTVTCDPAALRLRNDVQVVGFFGDRRIDADQHSIDTSEFDLIDEFVYYPGIMSYSSVELVDHYWANLVVHHRPEDREEWRGSAIHVRAVDEVAPRAYHSVRIHNGHIRGGVCGSATVVIEMTKYWDYDESPVWHATRRLPGGESEALVGPIAAADAVANAQTHTETNPNLDN